MASVRKRLLKSGKKVWLVDYKDQRGKRRSRQFPLKKDAEAFRKKAEREVSDRIHVVRSESILMKDCVEKWLKTKEKKGLEYDTLKAYRSHARIYIAPLIGDLKVSDICASDAEYLVDEIQDNISPKYLRDIFMTFQMIMKYAQKNSWGTPVGEAKDFLPKLEKTLVRIPSKKHVMELIKHHDIKTSALCSIASFCGLRPSESRGLKWEFVNLELGYIKVVQRLNDQRVLGETKTPAGVRSIPLPDLAIEKLENLKRSINPEPDHYVFLSSKGKPMTNDIIGREIWYPAMETQGLMDDGRPLFQFRLLRHFAASLFIEQGINAKRIQSFMGHRSIQTTFDRYGHLFPSDEDDRLVANRMQASVFGVANDNKPKAKGKRKKRRA